MMLPFRRTEQRKGDLVVELLELHFDLHVQFEGFRRLWAVNNVGHHPRALVELDDGNGVGWREAGCGGTVIDDIAVELALAARLEDRDPARGAGRAERPRRKIDMRASVAALQAQLASLRAIPEMLGLGC